MLPVKDIVKALKASRSEFGNLFLQAQIGLPAAQRQSFEVIARDLADDVEAFTQAIRVAQAGNWLPELVTAIIDEGLEDGTLAQDALTSATANNGNAELQAMVDAARGFEQPHVMVRGIANGMKWTGKVLVNGIAKGTAILIGPNLALTAWHVVKTLFRLDANGAWEADPGAGAQLQIEFDDFLVLVGQNRPLRPVRKVTVNAHQNWCVIFSNCHNDELDDLLPNDLNELNGKWDYVVIRLAKALGPERSWAPPNPQAVVPRPKERIVLFQHPAGQAMKMDHDFIAPTEAPLQQAIPRFRFLHTVNTLGGSSGAPCFDKSFTLFGLHQGVWSNGPNAGRAINRGIPLVRILEDIREKISDLPGLDPSESSVWKLNRNQDSWPVIGCDNFQALVWRSAVAGRPALLLIDGSDDSGKSFCVELLLAMLPDGGHLKVRLNAEAISKMDPAKLAATICATARAKIPDLSSPAEMNSTLTVWLKDEVMNKIIAALESVRNNRLVWISITELNQFEIQDAGTSQLLLLLYESLLNLNWLRIVLDGMRGDIPASLMRTTERYRTAPIMPAEIATYFRRFAAGSEFLENSAHIEATATILNSFYQTEMVRNPATALETLALYVKNYEQIYKKSYESALQG